MNAILPVDSSGDPTDPRPNVEGADDDEPKVITDAATVQRYRDELGDQDFYCDGLSIKFDGDIVIEKLDRS